MPVCLTQNSTTVTQAIVCVAYWLSVVYFTLAIDHLKTTIPHQQWPVMSMHFITVMKDTSSRNLQFWNLQKLQRKSNCIQGQKARTV